MPTMPRTRPVTASPLTRTVLAWLLFAATFSCLAAGLVVALLLVRPLTLAVLAEGALTAVLYLGFATLGLVLTLRRPANPVGWLLGASGLVWSLNVPAEAWVDNLVASGRPLPTPAQVYVAVSEPLWAPAIALGVTLPLLLLPDGHLRSPRWRWAVVAAVAGGVLSMAAAVQPGRLVSYDIANPLGLHGPAGAVATALNGLGGLLHVGGLVAALVCLVLRFRSSRGVERQQLRWVAAGAAATVVGLLAVIGLLSLEEQGILPGAWVVAIVLSLPCLPVAMAVAVLRYRLWDLDRLVSRTVTYGLLTLLLGLGYAGVVLGLGRLLPDSSSLAVAAATLAAAAAFQPLRRRVQDLVDRRFNRRRADTAGTVEAFAARLRDQVDLDALHGELLAVVTQTMQPTRASLWLRETPS
jgi:hypothetical protein